MAENTRIEWADHTFNPWTGCTKVSPACDHCYAEGWAKRSGHVEWGPHGQRRCTTFATWRQPRKWNVEAARAGRRARIFCASLADVFDNHRSIADQWRTDLWHLIHDTPHLDWLLLTKRPQNIAKMLPDGNDAPAWGDGWPNVWLGTTVENQTEADRRIPRLLYIPAKVHFLSCEPLLGPVDLHRFMGRWPEVIFDRETEDVFGKTRLLIARQPSTIDWVICGGESGPHARPMHPDWARSLRDQCQEAGVAFHFKQWGEWAPVVIEQNDAGGLTPAYPITGCSNPAAHNGGQRALFWQGEDLVEWPYIKTRQAIGARRIGKKAAGRLLDGREWNEVPQ